MGGGGGGGALLFQQCACDVLTTAFHLHHISPAVTADLIMCYHLKWWVLVCVCPYIQYKLLYCNLRPYLGNIFLYYLFLHGFSKRLADEA